MPGTVKGDEPGVKGVQKRLAEALTKAQAKELAILCEQLAERDAMMDLKTWLRSVEKTANHAAHLLCNDIEVGVRLLNEEREYGYRWSSLPLKEAVEDLAQYTVSERYLDMRREVGAAIEE